MKIRLPCHQCPKCSTGTACQNETIKIIHAYNSEEQMRQKVDQINTVDMCTPGKKGNPQEYQASWSFARRSVPDFLFLSVLEATAHQK